MIIVTNDGRRLMGTAAQIVRAMRELSFYPGADLRAFVASIATRLATSGGIDVGQPVGDDDEALCADLLARLEAAGAVSREEKADDLG